MHKLLIQAADSAVLPNALFLDCSFDLSASDAGRARFLERHIPGAHYCDLDRDLSSPAGEGGRHPLPEREALAAKLRALGLNPGQQVVAYDDGDGAFAARAWWLLRWLGHGAVAVLDGGLNAWREAGLPLETGDTLATLGTFQATPDPVLDTVTADQILTDPNLKVLDARATKRFRGEAQAFDAVPGHIPGAINRPYKDNLTPDGRFKPPATLAAEFRTLLGDHPLDQVALSCGSGVTACHNALALELAGLTGARLYPGSWSEWIRDPARPIATGA